MTESISRSSLRSGYRHGFKSHARRIADAERAALRLNPHDPLDVQALLEHLDLQLLPLSALAALGDTAWVGVAQLGYLNPSVFSGALISSRHGAAVIVNDFHNPVRQRASIAHEAGHRLLGHINPPPQTGVSVPIRDAEIEREADFLGMCLLVPEDFTVRVARNSGATTAAQRAHVITNAATLMGVSADMMQFAFNTSGAWKRAERVLR